MSIYVLDATFKRIGLVDSYKSFIWTERYNEAGDWEVVVKSTKAALELFQVGRLVMKEDTKRVMMIQKIVEAKIDGLPSIKVSGDSLEGLLKARGAVYSLGVYNNGSPLMRKPTQIFREIIFRSFVNAGIMPAPPADRVAGTWPFVQAGLAESLPDVADSQDTKQSYDMIKDYLDPHQVGFKVIYTPDDREDPAYFLEWWCYKGIERPNVVFSPALGNFVDVETLTTNVNYYDRVQYFGGKGALYGSYVQAKNYSSGVAHRSKSIRDTSVVPDEDLSQAGVVQILYQMALAEFGRGHRDQIISGNVIDSTGFTYDVDYNLGDLVTVRDSRDRSHQLIVTEHVLIRDDTGESSYPSFSQIATADTTQTMSALSSDSAPPNSIPAR